ncbi:ribosomal protein L11 [Glomus cerebriforme]|uniref:Large ribosomal subunit protein uL11m n=1 Tax=Glomus cerebriforme TaxID=658196 RepID=A0A397T8M9_9GLOM|nr:ribosomal protein L11 [Glomus cerebriforme]
MAAIAKIRALVPAGNARPTPPIGPMLGQRGLKAIDFCKQFNEVTKKYEVDTPIPTIITPQPDRKFTFTCNMPPTSWLLKRAAKIEKGAAKPKHEIVGKVSLKHIYEIAKIKQKQENMKDFDLEGICKSIIATSSSIGIEVVP